MEDKNKPLNNIVKGGLLLTASAFIAKLLSAMYKVPFQNLTGDEGFYVYQQIYPIYGLAATFSLTGLPAFVSKVVSEARDEESLNHKMQEINTWFVTIGLALFLGLQLGAGWLASAMGDPNLAAVIRSVSYFFLFLPFLALIRGYFQGHSKMLPTSSSQVIEQLVRVLILLGVAFLSVQNSWSVYEMGAWAYQSAWVSALAGSLVLFLYLKRSHQFSSYLKSFKPRWSWTMGGRLLSEGLLLVAVSSVMNILQFIDSFTVFNGLIATGYSNEMAMMLKGIYDRGQPLIQLGLVVGMGFSMTSLPILRKWAMANNWSEWTENAASVIKITMILSSAASIGLAAVMPWMNHTLFTDQEGTRTLQMLVLSIVVGSLIYAVHMVLQSTNHAGNSLLILLTGLGFKVIMNQLAVRTMGIFGSSVVTFLSLVIICVLMIQMIPRAIWKKVFQNQFIVKIMSLLAGMYGVVWGAVALLQEVTGISGRTGSLFLTLFGVGIGALFFIGGAMWFNLLDENELEQLPFSKLFQKLKRK